VNSTDPDVNTAFAEIVFNGQGALQDNSIPTFIDLTDWEYARIYISGLSSPWHVDAVIVSIEPLPPEYFVTIVPGDAPIHFEQRFDTAIRLNGLPAVVNYTGTLNNQDITEYLESSCYNYGYLLQEEVILCRETNEILETGKNTLSIRLELANSQTITKQVVWTVD
jgi:hypothetical protein